MNEIMSGPCVCCGATGYALSMGGPSICPACDCGRFGGTVLAIHNAKLTAELQASEARALSLEAEKGRLREALVEYRRLHGSVALDLLSAHQGRGNGTTQWMTEEDNDLRREFRAAGDLASQALAEIEGKEER